MKLLTEQIHRIQQVLSVPWKERTATFERTFTDPMTLIEARRGDRITGSLVALCDEEIAPLKTTFLKPPGLYKSPVSMPDTQITTRPVTIAELCHASDARDPRNGNAQEALNEEILRDLLKRFAHLQGHDVSQAESWVWHSTEPYPIIDGKLHFRPRKYQHAVRDEDLWFEMPMRHRRELLNYAMGELDFQPPDRLALTLPTGKMQAFVVADGFVGPEDFVWLQVLPTKFSARATYEGIRDSDLQYMPRNLEEANARWELGIKPYGTAAFDRGDEPPRITGTHAYGPGWETGSLIRVTRQGYSLIPNIVRAEKGAEHMISLIVRDGDTLNGPWHIAKDGAVPTGPTLGKVGAPWWGYEVRLGHDDREHAVEHWRVVLGSTCDFAGPNFVAPPKLGPLSKSLIGRAKGKEGTDGKWGAICPHTGQELVPFEFAAYEDAPYDSECMIFTDDQDRHHVFDPTGKLVLGPLKTFDIPKVFGPPQPTAYETRESEKQRRWSYIRLDLPRWYKRATAQERFGDLDRHATTLAAFAGRLTDGRKDAEMAGLWYASVEIVKDGTAHGVALSQGMIGRVEFGEAAAYGGSSMFNWLKELPVVGLVPGSPGRVVGVPFDYLHIPPRERNTPPAPKKTRWTAKEWADRLCVFRWVAWILASLSLVANLFWEELPVGKIWIAAILIFIVCWLIETQLNRRGRANSRNQEAPEVTSTEVIFKQVDEVEGGKETEELTLRQYSDGKAIIQRYSGGPATRHASGYYDNEAFLEIPAHSLSTIGEDALKEMFANGWTAGKEALQVMEQRGEIDFKITILNGS
ncbi:hypothetical protein [Thalassobius sp. Cn5-15]|uniref:hypothetical protein n=1 Tax=Thalassobius sp. Cn5-15 TaxID=2917763 RepID=UPI001EF2C81A|nr:hypothetical protein [Thalassobius sp. Cn5-15]MCG7494104.1 hypothetical protein [Thalassobius sp. Cn5-15]